MILTKEQCDELAGTTKIVGFLDSSTPANPVYLEDLLKTIEALRTMQNAALEERDKNMYRAGWNDLGRKREQRFEERLNEARAEARKNTLREVIGLYQEMMGQNPQDQETEPDCIVTELQNRLAASGGEGRSK
jgi:hypothetical protein